MILACRLHERKVSKEMRMETRMLVKMDMGEGGGETCAEGDGEEGGKGAG